MNKSVVSIAGVAVLGLALTACGEPKEVSGLRDDVRYDKAVHRMVTRQVADYQRQCSTKFKTVTKSSGTGTNRRTWTESVPYQDCKNVRIGSHPETKRELISAAKYCVELDHVKDGDSYHDDVWFNVDRAAYYSAAGKREGAKVSKMRYNHEGC